MARGDPQIVLRVPAPLHARIRELAAANDRSMNGEVVHHLKRAIGPSAESAADPTRRDLGTQGARIGT